MRQRQNPFCQPLNDAVGVSYETLSVHVGPRTLLESRGSLEFGDRYRFIRTVDMGGEPRGSMGALILLHLYPVISCDQLRRNLNT